MKQQIRGISFVMVFVVLAAIAGGAWKYNAYRAQQKQEALKQALKTVDEFVSRWEDAARVAGVTSRIALTAPVTAMQNLKREASALVMPACLNPAKASLDKSITNTIEAYMVFMTERNNLGKELTIDMLSAAAEDMAKFKRMRSACDLL